MQRFPEPLPVNRLREPTMKAGSALVSTDWPAAGPSSACGCRSCRHLARAAGLPAAVGAHLQGGPRLCCHRCPSSLRSQTGTRQPPAAWRADRHSKQRLGVPCSPGRFGARGTPSSSLLRLLGHGLRLAGLDTARWTGTKARHAGRGAQGAAEVPFRSPAGAPGAPAMLAGWGRPARSQTAGDAAQPCSARGGALTRGHVAVMRGQPWASPDAELAPTCDSSCCALCQAPVDCAAHPGPDQEALVPDLGAAADCQELAAVPSGSHLAAGSKSHSWPLAEPGRCASPSRAGSAPGALCRDCASSNTLDQLAVPQLPEHRRDAFVALHGKRKRSVSEDADRGARHPAARWGGEPAVCSAPAQLGCLPQALAP